MKKSLWILGVAVIALTGCTNNEVVDIPQSRAINFSNAFVNNTTRADVTNADFTQFFALTTPQSFKAHHGLMCSTM